MANKMGPGLQNFMGRRSTGDEHQSRPASNARRQRIGDQAYIKPPAPSLTHHGKNDTLSESYNNNYERTYQPPSQEPELEILGSNGLKPSHSTEQERGAQFYETDIEDVDNTTSIGGDFQEQQAYQDTPRIGLDQPGRDGDSEAENYNRHPEESSSDFGNEDRDVEEDDGDDYIPQGGITVSPHSAMQQAPWGDQNLPPFETLPQQYKSPEEDRHQDGKQKVKTRTASSAAPPSIRRLGEDYLAPADIQIRPKSFQGLPEESSAKLQRNGTLDFSGNEQIVGFKRNVISDLEDLETPEESFKDIGAKDFDIYPNLPESGLPEHLHGKSLPEKLKHIVHSSNRKQQDRFFASLDLKQWEEGGDWLLSEFGDLVNKMKEARSQRRKVLSQFENELSQRESIVDIKEKETRHALEGMKKGGEQVLNGNKLR